MTPSCHGERQPGQGVAGCGVGAQGGTRRDGNARCPRYDGRLAHLHQLEVRIRQPSGSVGNHSAGRDEDGAAAQQRCCHTALAMHYRRGADKARNQIMEPFSRPRAQTVTVR
jgi:hypothetical protein